MSLKDEIRMLAEFIVRENGGKMMFNLGETALIVGQGINSIRTYLQADGITVKKVGQEKLVNAIQIAEFMCKNRIAPIDNKSRGIVIHDSALARATASA
jgi:hypothetical protein